MLHNNRAGGEKRRKFLVEGKENYKTSSPCLRCILGNKLTWVRETMQSLHGSPWGKITQKNITKISQGANFLDLPGIRHSSAAALPTTALWRGLPAWVGGSDPGLLRCVPAAPRSSVGEVNPSPDDGRELPDLQLCGRAGSTSTDRSFVGLWPWRS